MPTNYVLIDFENVQPKTLEFLTGYPSKKTLFKVLVFVGATQSEQHKALCALRSEMQSLGVDAKYIKISENGKNVLDFHIAYYIGKLSNQYPEASFRIISGDKGFDPLIKHLKGEGLGIQRIEIPVLPVPDKKIAAVVKSKPKKAVVKPKKAVVKPKKAVVKPKKAVVKSKKAVVKSKPKKVKTLANASGNTSDNEKIAVVVKSLRGCDKSRPKKIKTLENAINNLFTKETKKSELLLIIEELQRRGYIEVSDSNVSYLKNW